MSVTDTRNHRARRRGPRRALAAVAAAALAVAAVAADPAPGSAGAPSAAPIDASPPPFSEGIFPCSQCHQGGGDPTRRQLAMHEEVQARFRHDAEHRWCLDCHDERDRDVLRSASGAPIPFTESYRLCGQCHGDKYRDWRAGIHGKRVGRWDGAKTTSLCVQCHDPHAPRFQPLAPLPPPVRPVEMKR
jgi:hypothetical protein